jgi:hypothetical protein
MKIRSGFVSNSSSSSFVISVIGEANKCPTCGHHPQTVVDFFKQGHTCSYGDESYLEEIDEYLDELDYERNACASHIAELEKRDPNEPTYPEYRDSSKVKETLQWRHEELQELEDRIAKFNQLTSQGKKVYRLRLEYHDGLARRILDENIATGLVEVIEGEN